MRKPPRITMYFPAAVQRLVSLWIIFFLLCIDFSPLSGSPAAHAFSIKDEREYGEKMLAVIRREFKLVDELDVLQYVNDLGDAVLAGAGNQYFDYRFYVINNKEFNAFATPSGLIFFHSGIIGAMDTEGEFVSVLAHECGHVMCRHIAQRIENSLKVSAGTLAMMLAGIALGGGALSQALVTGGMATGAALNLEFSRQDEEEADRVGFTLMEKQQRDPKDMLSMLNKMYRESKIRMGNIPQYLLTHPKPKLRMDYVEDLMHVKGAGGYRDYDQFDFLRMQKRVASLTQEPQKLFARYRKEMREAPDETTKIMATYGLALADVSIGNYEQGVEKLRQVIRAFPDKPILLADLGRIYVNGGQLETARMYLEEARAKNPDCWYSNYHLALVLQQSGNSERAEALFKQIMDHVPDYPDVYFQLGQIESKRGNLMLSHLYLGKNFYYAGNFPVSTFHLKKALALAVGPEREEIVMLLAKIKEVE
ncbi:MAG: M48 family metalloprotease [Thermodesulfobacteriota bacterium]